MNAFADRLDLVGTLAGVFLVLVALGTLSGQPWQYSGSALVMALQLVGIVATAALGVALVWLAHYEA